MQKTHYRVPPICNNQNEQTNGQKADQWFLAAESKTEREDRKSGKGLFNGNMAH